MTAGKAWHDGDYCIPSRCHGSPMWYSRGGASLQACVLVLLFAAYVTDAYQNGQGGLTIDGDTDWSHPVWDD